MRLNFVSLAFCIFVVLLIGNAAQDTTGEFKTATDQSQKHSQQKETLEKGTNENVKTQASPAPNTQPNPGANAQPNAGANAQANPLLLNLVGTLLRDPNTLMAVGKMLLANLNTEWLKNVPALLQMFKQMLLLYGGEVVTQLDQKQAGTDNWVADLAREFLPPFTALDFIPIKAREYFPRPFLLKLTTIGQSELNALKSIFNDAEQFASWEEFFREFKSKAPNVYQILMDAYEEGKQRVSMFHESLNEKPKELFNQIIETLSKNLGVWYEAFIKLSPNDLASIRRAVGVLVPEFAELIDKLLNNRAFLMHHLRTIVQDDPSVKENFQELNEQLENVFKRMTQKVEDGEVHIDDEL